MRGDFDREFGYELADEQWQTILEHRYLSDVESGSRTVAEVVAEIKATERRLRRLVTPAEDRLDRERPSGEATTARIDALSAIFAAWAERDTSVASFRSRHLVDPDGYSKAVIGRTPMPPYGLLTADEVLPWIMARYDEERVMAPATAVTVLWYIDQRQEQRVSVPVLGELGDLAKLADKLVDRYRWAPSEASMFVLTGRTPEVFVYQGTVNVRYRPAATTRITLTVDPSLTPQQVAETYSRLRQQITPTEVPKSQGLRRYLLAGHVGPHVDIGFERVADRVGPGRRPRADANGQTFNIVPSTGYSWNGLRTSWNERYGDQTDERGRALAYREASNFTTHAKAALRHLLYPPWRLAS